MLQWFTKINESAKRNFLNYGNHSMIYIFRGLLVVSGKQRAYCIILNYIDPATLQDDGGTLHFPDFPV